MNRLTPLVTIVMILASPWLSAATGQQMMTSIEGVAVPPDVQAEDVKLCMSTEDFQSGPGKDFSLSLTLSTLANRVFFHSGEFKFLRNYGLFRSGAKTPVEILAEFSGDRLADFRLRFKTYGESETTDVYDALHDQVLHAYSIGPSGPVFVVEDRGNQSRYGRLLLVDKYGDSLLLNTCSDSVGLAYYARGRFGSPGSNAAGVVLGRYPRFCEPVSGSP